MEREDVEKRVVEIVFQQFGVKREDIKPESHFIDDLNADSLDSVELIMEFEDVFEISISDEEAEQANTLGRAVDMIYQKVKNESQTQRPS